MKTILLKPNSLPILYNFIPLGSDNIDLKSVSQYDTIQNIMGERVFDFNLKDEAAPKVDLLQQTYNLLHFVRKPSKQEEKALERKGIVFLPLKRKSYAQVVSENQAYFWAGELDYAKARPPLRDYVLPVAVEVGFNPAQLALPGSTLKSRPVQLQMIEDYSQKLQAEFSDARAVMLPSTGYAQADRVYKAKTGNELFGISIVTPRTLDNLSGMHVADDGCSGPAGRFGVIGWYARGDFDNLVCAVPAVVFVRNK